MKLSLLFLILAGLGLAQDQSRLRIIVTMPDGTEHIARVTNAPAAAGMDVLRQWMATQTVCTTAPPVDGVAQEPVCVPKFANPAEFIKSLVLDTAERLAPQYPSAALKPLVDAAKAEAAKVEAARKAAFDAARSEK
jgi:hypothetical protein